jgi:hypothetical protein
MVWVGVQVAERRPTRPLAADRRAGPHRRRTAADTRAGLAADRPPRPPADARLHRHPCALPAGGRDRQLGHRLLDWLDTYTFPAEQRWADPAVAQAGAAYFLDALLAHGTTAAVVFPTVHAGSADALFAAASSAACAWSPARC